MKTLKVENRKPEFVANWNCLFKKNCQIFAKG